MKIKTLIVMALTGCLSITQSNAQNQTTKLKHSINFGPQVGYHLDQKIVLFGAGIGYEYRLNNNWGLIINANYNTGVNDKNNPSSYNIAGNIAQLVNVANYNTNVGVKFYLKRFYISAAVGYGQERELLKYNHNNTRKWISNNGITQFYGVGYQIPMKKNMLEIFANAGGVRDLTVITGLRLNFGLGK